MTWVVVVARLGLVWFVVSVLFAALWSLLLGPPEDQCP